MTFKSLITALALASTSVALMGTTADAQQVRKPLASLGQALQPSAVQVPGETDQVRMVNTTIDIFLEAVKAKSMRSLRERLVLLVTVTSTS